MYVYVVALIDGKHVSKQLPVIRKALTCYKLLEVLLKEIECCPGLMTGQRIVDGERCAHCSRTSQLAGKGTTLWGITDDPLGIVHIFSKY